VGEAGIEHRDRGDGKPESLPAQVFLIKVCRQLIKNNNYLVVDPGTRQGVMVDPAWELEALTNALATSQATLSGILITHAHLDHIDLAARLSELYDCPIWMSRQEIENSGYQARRLVAIDENPWFVGEMQIEPILSPGHTPGCVCYLVGDNLFTGDVLFPEGCGICPDIKAAHQMFDSLALLKTKLKPHTRLFPGHTYVMPPGQLFSDVLRRNRYLRFSDKDSFAAYRLRQGQSLRKQMNFR
jgi:hydroxyacylglutathione hydrolase